MSTSTTATATSRTTTTSTITMATEKAIFLQAGATDGGSSMKKGDDKSALKGRRRLSLQLPKIPFRRRSSTTAATTTTTTVATTISTTAEQHVTPLKASPKRPLHERRRWSFPKTSIIIPNRRNRKTKNDDSTGANNAFPNAITDQIVTRYESSSSPTGTATAPISSNNSKESEDDNHRHDSLALVPVETPTVSSTMGPTAILRHSYLEYVCGCGTSPKHAPSSWDEEDDDEDNDHELNGLSQRRLRRTISEDPTVQESIECVFASQLQAGLPNALWEEDDDEDDDDDDKHSTTGSSHRASLVSPASLLQSRASSRSNIHSTTTTTNNNNNLATQPTSRVSTFNNSMKYQTASLVHVTTLDRTPDSPIHATDEGKKQESDPTTPAASSSVGVATATIDDNDDDDNGAADNTNHSATDSNGATITTNNATITATTTTTSAFICPCCKAGRHSPWTKPQEWPQFPLLLKPSPDSGTRILGVRYSNTLDRNHTPTDETSSSYIWKPTDGGLWNQVLLQEWGQQQPSPPPPPSSEATTTTDDAAPTTTVSPPWCEHCCILPINNGNEEKGKSLLIDFESDYFIGSLLLRLRHAEGTTPLPYNDHIGYFCGMNRRYQAVVQGRFKKSLPWTRLVTGFQLERPCGKLPPKWILKGALKVVSFFAPQLEAKLDVDKPSSLTPLGSTPQVIALHDYKNNTTTNTDDNQEDQPQQDTGSTSLPPDMDIVHEEPREVEHTLLGYACDSSISLHRARFRKKAFDKLYVQHQHDVHHQHDHHQHQQHSPKEQQPQQLLTRTDKIYTMEFLQHLFNFQDFSMELGSMLGSVKLQEVLDGQPLQFMACHHNEGDDEENEDVQARRRRRLWSFDIWHASLVEDAKKYDPIVVLE